MSNTNGTTTTPPPPQTPPRLKTNLSDDATFNTFNQDHSDVDGDIRLMNSGSEEMDYGVGSVAGGGGGGDSDEGGEVDSTHGRTDSQSDFGGDAMGGGGGGGGSLKYENMSNFDMVGSLHKRRGGFGRNADNNWVKRVFTLNGPILCYYEEPDTTKFDPSNPRGRINLMKEDTTTDMRLKRKSGAPTEFLVAVHICVIGKAKKKWEMCCMSREQQIRWFDALRIFDGKPDHHDGLGAAAAGAAAAGGSSAVKAPQSLKMKASVKNRDFNPEAGVGVDSDAASTVVERSQHQHQHQHQQEQEQEQGQASPLANGNEKNEATPSTKPTEMTDTVEASEQEHATPPPTMRILIAFSTLNVACYFIRVGSVQTLCIAIVLANLSMLYLLNHTILDIHESNNSIHTTSSTETSKTSNQSLTRMTSIGSTIFPPPTNQKTTPRPPHTKSFSKIRPAGSTIQRAPPKPNTALHELLHKQQQQQQQQQQSHPNNNPFPPPPPPIEAVRAYPTAQYNDTVPHTYHNTLSHIFKLRIGPNYKKNKKKAPSTNALYQLLYMDVMEANSTLKRVQDGFALPSIPGLTDVDTGHDHIPSLLVINNSLPAEDAKLLGKNTGDGKCYVVVLYFVIAEEVLEELKDLDKARPGVRLMSEWMRRCGEGDEKFRSKLKIMGVVEDIEKSGLPSFIQGYNGKPAMVTKSGSFHKYSTHAELSVNVLMWAYAPRKGLFTLKSHFSKFVLNVGYTIQGDDDSELPEVLLGGCRVLHLDPERVEKG